MSCRPLTFQITAGPTGGFGTPSGTSVTVTSDAVLPVATARLWLSYTSTNPGDVGNGSVTVRCNETGQVWTIPIMASTVARPKAAVALVLDRSGSMNDDAGDGRSKVQKLREAANAFVDVMRAGDGIGITIFNETATRVLEVQDVAGAGATAHGIISGNQLDPAGATSIGDGVVQASAMLAAATPVPPYDVKAMVVLTDGQWNRPPSLASIGGSITANTFAVGLGLPSNISVTALSTLCQGHSGYLLVTGALTPSQSMRLSKYFVQILAGITNAAVIADPGGVLSRGAEHRIPFWLTEADYSMDAIVLTPFPQAVDFQLETPDGTRIDPSTAGNLQYVVGSSVAYYRCALPVLPADASGSHGGQWNAVLTLGNARGRQRAPDDHYGRNVPYEFVAHTYSALSFDAHLTQASFELGAVAVLDASLSEYDAPPTATADVWAEIAWPDGSADAVPLRPGPNGRYRCEYPLAVPGVYAFRIRARGETIGGRIFEREKTLTAVAVRGGDSGPSGGQECCDLDRLIDCVASGAGVTDKGYEWLEERGFDLRSLLRCLTGK